MYNRIRLVKGERTLMMKEYERFSKGDAIIADGCEAEILNEWSIDQEEEAKDALNAFKCEYNKYINCVDIVEYALEYYEADEEGEFVAGSDFIFA